MYNLLELPADGWEKTKLNCLNNLLWRINWVVMPSSTCSNWHLKNWTKHEDNK